MVGSTYDLRRGWMPIIAIAIATAIADPSVGVGVGGCGWVCIFIVIEYLPPIQEIPRHNSSIRRVFPPNLFWRGDITACRN